MSAINGVIYNYSGTFIQNADVPDHQIFFKIVKQHENPLWGYADDSFVLVCTDEVITESMKVIKKYEPGTGACLNYEKTSIFGMGDVERKI